MSAAQERRRQQAAQASDTPSIDDTAPDTSNGLALSGRDMKYMLVGGTMFIIALIVGIKSLVPVRQILETVAKAG